ncbi:UDP-3-O-(3-hydroxymyristoyl)glucosamine N-acyltransferase [Acetobacter sp. AN02]|uniref:UDP-3-O-(3-hydroxymyristoyl)glucosamine N-acyltransferase n=1 Tax=Acetobacter sp. AN02 TaxID=2894186 RepID=UPI0024343670|nr:UDP-3-O-(3-hydroxymyristoyl)glucosamine N-acyltransferase [Acetobacter sp. AN02]MDG6094372.1 UDP-3-O-(3-hydroxymyristoyl)glucosamine N-acyltransferase [Acetobacter sp. AN02]
MSDPNGSAGAADPRFFARPSPQTAEALAAAAGAELILPRCGSVPEGGFTGIGPLQSAGPSDVSFLDNRRYAPLLEQTRAGLVIVAKAFAARVPDGCAVLVAPVPYLAWSRVARLFYPRPAAVPGRHPSACIAADAVVDETSEIGPFAVIGARAEIGPGTVVSSHAVIGDAVVIGRDCRIGSHVSVSHALIGDRVTLFPGARIGQDGFGFAVGPEGFETVPQLGRVILGDDVEIGANATIDRGSVQDTVIGRGSRLDNLVQIGHNTKLGQNCIIVSQAGVSGSTELGDRVTVAAQAGLIGHIRIGTGARIGAQCGVMSDVEAGADVIGSPAMPFREFFRNVATLRRLSRRPAGNGQDAGGDSDIT